MLTLALKSPQNPNHQGSVIGDNELMPYHNLLQKHLDDAELPQIRLHREALMAAKPKNNRTVGPHRGIGLESDRTKLGTKAGRTLCPPSLWKSEK